MKKVSFSINRNGEETTVTFSNEKSFISMLFGGRDGMQRDNITLEELEEVFRRLAED